MESLQQLKDYGESLGYEGEELRKFIRDQQTILRDERNAQRQKDKEEREYTLALEETLRLKVKEEHEAASTKEKLDREYEIELRKNAIEKEKLDQELKMKQIMHDQQLELMQKQSELKVSGEPVVTSSVYTKARSPKIPAFEEGKDEMDSYLHRFERYATAQKWDPNTWAINLSALLKGRALDVYALMAPEQANDYDMLKSALLKRYDLTEDGFKRKFRSSRPEPGETFAQFAVRLASYLTRWVQMSKIEKTYEALFDLMARDQFIHICNRDLALFLKERIPKSVKDMADLADQFREARFTSAVNLTGKGNFQQVASQQNQKGNQGRGKLDFNKSSDQSSQSSQPKQDYRKSFVPKSERKCYKCGKMGHIAPECLSRLNKVGNVIHEVDNDVNISVAELSETECVDTQPKLCGACTIPIFSYSDSHTSTPTLSSSCQNTIGNMPTTSGFCNGYKVTVLRDTGCSGIVVRRSKVKDENLTGTFQLCILANGSTVKAPVANVNVDTPYLTGTYKAWCMEEPVYDLIIGNLCEARDPGNPDPEWKPPVYMVETRQQTRDKGKKIPPLRVPEIIKEEISPDEIREAQKTDPSLSRIRELATEGRTFSTKTGKVSWYIKKGMIYREFHSPSADNGKMFKQLVVPKQYRAMVMKLAHESIMSGHLATRRTTYRVLTEFYWPGVKADTRRFCQSCDICQKMVAKGRTMKVPLQKMPLIDEPFKRVAVDLIGPLHPITDRGNRYILTLVDYATRYPEAIALKTIDTERVAEALVDIFSRVGIPQEMLTDMGSQFTSNLMSEVSRLISLKQLTTTPYHPMCNGLVERFNGTLKQMLKRMCAERPKDWDKYLNAVLFAYREVPQESLGFSPFELVYGRSVRGPITILKELWTKEIEDPQVKSTHQYIIDLRERLESTCELARENLERASRKYKHYYNRTARQRSMKVGEKVLVLLPTDSNKMLMQWKGPFVIVEKIGRVDYKINMNGKIKTFHANLLKRYVERSKDSNSEQVLAQVHIAVIDWTSENEADDELPEMKKTEGIDQVDVNPHLTQKQKSEIKELLLEFSDVLSDLPGCTNLIQHDIKTTTNSPVRDKSHWIPYAVIETVNDEVSNMLELRVIEPSDSPYCANLVLVKKKDNTNRVCVDFRSINKITIFDAEPMPNAEEMFAKFAGHMFYSRLDMSKGYWQVPLTETSKQKTAFQTPKGLFQFRVMPFGLVTAAATFSRLMRKLLHGMHSVDNFIDDVIIFTLTFERHVEVLRELFVRIRQAHLTIKPSKCSIGYSSLECLGHLVGEDKLKPLPDKVQVINEAQRPATKKQLRSFLGLIGFYRKFVPNFAQVAAPLTDLTKKGAPNKIVWENAHENAFESLKRALTVSPILKLPDMGEQFILQTDASSRGLGSVLMQYDSGKKMPIAYASRKLKPSEIAYSTIEKECLAIIWSIQKFNRYLYGKEFVIETDHQPLIYLNKAKLANARLMRWAISLQPYRFRVVAIKGKDNVGADYLSRL